MTISRSALAPAVLTLALALGGCSLLAAPEPDPTLVTLLRSATADGRSEDATALENEIYRLCGQHDDGSTPESCQDPLISQEGTTPVHENSGQIILDNIATVPQDSLAVVVPQYTALAAAGNAVPPVHAADLSAEANSKSNDEDLNADIDSVTSALNHELAAIYGLGVASSFADSDTRGQIMEMIDQRQERVRALEETLASADAVAENQTLPTGDAAYDLSAYTTPVDEGTARAFLTEIAADDESFWEATTSRAHAQSWRYQSLVVAGLAAQRAASL